MKIHLFEGDDIIYPGDGTKWWNLSGGQKLWGPYEGDALICNLEKAHKSEVCEIRRKVRMTEAIKKIGSGGLRKNKTRRGDMKEGREEVSKDDEAEDELVGIFYVFWSEALMQAS